VFAVPVGLGELMQPSPNRLRRSARRGRQRGEGEMEEEGKKGKGRDRKRRSGLSPSRKISEATMLQFITKLVIDGKLLIEMGSSFRISLRLYLILVLQKFFTQS